MLGAHEVVGVASAAVDEPAEVMSNHQAVVLLLADVPEQLLHAQLTVGEEDGQRRIQDLVNDKLKELRDLLWPPNLHISVLLDGIFAIVKVDA